MSHEKRRLKRKTKNDKPYKMCGNVCQHERTHARTNDLKIHWQQYKFSKRRATPGRRKEKYSFVWKQDEKWICLLRSVDKVIMWSIRICNKFIWEFSLFFSSLLVLSCSLFSVVFPPRARARAKQCSPVTFFWRYVFLAVFLVGIFFCHSLDLLCVCWTYFFLLLSCLYFYASTFSVPKCSEK